jgi:MYXO-CTERM domain-containing protein
LAIVFLPLTASAATYYVSPTGSDTAAGTMAAPFASWARAQTAAAAGDTVYFRGGTYAYTDATSTCTSTTATVNAVVLSKSGTSGSPINYWAYPGETPVFDFSGISDTSKYSCRQTGVRVEADWLYLKGLELKGTLQLNMDNHESWCVYVYGGNNNVFELLNAHHNMGPGFFMQRGGNNTFLNCDSHENEDTLTSNGDGQSADGFGCHPNQTGDTGNLFHGCRAWWNSDDGWDFIASTEVCTVEYSWSWYQGYKPDALTGGAPVPLAAGNGNGFKGGGYGIPPTGVPAVPPQHIIRLNAAFFNKAAGFYANHSPVSQYFYNNTSYKNAPDFNMLGEADDGGTSISVGILRNNLAYGGTATSNATLGGGLISDEFNSWDTSLDLATITNADFQSVAFAPPASCPEAYTAGGTVCVPPTDTTSFAGMASARQADGSLPVLPFLRLSATSELIAKGTNVGLPFSGSAPDLGCFDTALAFDPTDGGTSTDASTGGGAEAGTSTDASTGGGAEGGTSSTDASVDGSSATGDGGGATDGASSTEGDSGTSSAGDSGNASTDAGGTMSSTDARGTGTDGSIGAGDSGLTGGESDNAEGNGSNAGCGCRVANGGAPLGGVSVLALGFLGLAGRRRKTSRRRPL